jgi:hypothetical protein
MKNIFKSLNIILHKKLPSNDFNKLFKFTNFYFARNINKKLKETTTEPEMPKNIETQFENQETKFDPSQLDRMVYSLYKKSKFNVLDANRQPLNQHERHFEYYNYILENIKRLSPEYLTMFIKAMCHFKFKDERFTEALSFFLTSSKSKLQAASLILYALSVLEIKNENLKNQAIQILQTNDFTGEDKSVILPMLHSLTEWGFNNESINLKVDEFVKLNENQFNEHVIEI